MKKLISLLLVLALACTCVFGVFAEGEEEEENLLEIKGITFASSVDGEVVEYVRGGAADNTVLIDGDFMEGAQATPNHQAKGIVLVCNTRCTEAGVYPEYSYTLELSESGTFDAIKLGTYEYFMAMIGLPKDNTVSVEASSDGAEWDLVGDFTFEGEAVKEEVAGNVYEIELGKAVTAKFIKLTFAFGDSPFGTAEYGNSEKVIWEWHGFTEFAVVGTDIIDIGGDESEPAGDESEPAGDESEPAGDESEPAGDESEPAGDESEDEGQGGEQGGEQPGNDPAPQTGDAGVIALAIVSVIALGGAVIVKKSK